MTAVASREEPLRQILELTRTQWDHPGERGTVRENFHKVLKCKTEALGGEVYASAAGEKVFFHTCKSKCCPSCGNRGTQLWQREQWAVLPDVPFVGIVLTMPDVFWPVFKAHRHLQHDLPALGASVLRQWAWSRHKAQLCIIVIQHTFGGRLNHNPHLHIMVSAGGLKPAEGSWLPAIDFRHKDIMTLWRFAVTNYLRRAYRDGLLRGPGLPKEFDQLTLAQAQRNWNVYISPQMPKKHFLGNRLGNRMNWVGHRRPVLAI